MRLRDFWARVTGRSLRQAQEELHASSQWSREEMAKLQAQATRNRVIAEQQEKEALERVNSLFKDLPGR